MPKLQSKSKRKRILFFFLFLMTIYIGWLGLQVAVTKTYKNPELQQTKNEAVGVYHIHSTFSDGRKTTDKIARIAAAQGLDFMIFTDHGHPNYESLEIEGKKFGILVLAGSELSVNRGHLAALGFSPPSQPFSQNAEEAVYQIRAQGGFSIICHPYSKVKWSWGRNIGYSGIEIINGNTVLRKGLFRSLPYLPLFILKSEIVVLKMIENPYKNLRKWDELCRENPMFAYYATDAHLLYGPAFQTLHIHVCLDNPLSENFKTAKKQINYSLQNGRFYNAIDAAADASGFQFYALSENKVTPMGTTLTTNSPVNFHIRTPFAFRVETQLLCNGNDVLTSKEKEIVFTATDPGTYRVQVFLRERSPLDKKIPWILSNPIFLR